MLPATLHPLTLKPCAMSRGRGGLSREQYHRHPPPNLLAKEIYNRPGPSSLYLRPGPQQAAFSSCYHSPPRPVAPFQPPAPFLNAAAPPIPNHNKVARNLVAPNSSHSPQHGSIPGTKAFYDQQVAFLKQTPEGPWLRASPCVGGREVVPGRLPGSSYQHGSGYNRYSKPNNSYRSQGSYRQDQSFRYPTSVRASRDIPNPRYVNQRELRGQKHSNNSNRQWFPETDSLSENFQCITLQDRPRGRGEWFDKYGTSRYSANLSFTKGNITLTPDIQEQVYRILSALKPTESICAKLLAKKLRLPKKIVNKALYSLEHSQKASKQGLYPPEWTLYKEHLSAQNSTVPVLQHHSSEQPPESNFELETEVSSVDITKEDSDTESSSSNSSESSDSIEFSAPTEGRCQQKDYPCTIISADQELKHPTMTDQKELILQYLLNSQEATSLVIAKNLGLRNANQVNVTLNALEKLGDVIRNREVNPPTWELSTRRRERMERSLKAAQSTHSRVTQMEIESRGDEMAVRSGFLPSSPVPPIPGLEPLPLSESLMPEQSHSEGVGSISVCIFLYTYTFL